VENESRQPSQSREQFLRVAESLFSVRGYTSVTLKEIADQLEVKQAAIYYHFPNGKEELFVEVTRRSFRRHQQGLAEAIDQAAPNLAAQLKAIADWLLSQPPINMSRMARSDLPALSAVNIQELNALGEQALIDPIERVLRQGYERGEIRLVDSRTLATVFLAMMDTLHDLHLAKKMPKAVLAQDMIDVLLDGMRRR
jgi:TetR/AcrR family transcriptional regulator, cholesterol catabolism regulator